jgi:GNAT superfamily N-acetyltransferase
MTYTIRPAVIRDMPAVHALIVELAVFEREPDAVTLTVEQLIEDGFGLSAPRFHCFVAEDAEGIAGMALIYPRYSTWKGKSLHLEDLIVKEEKRGIGAGFALYTEIMKQGKKDNVRRIEWNVLDWNTPAITFYNKSGAKLLDDWRVVQMDEAGMNHFLLKI